MTGHMTSWIYMSQWGIVFNRILVDDSTSFLNTSSFLGPRYLSKNIPWTLKRCHCLRISTSTIVSSIVFAVQISRFNYWRRSIVASAFSVKRAKMDLDGVYCIRLNRIFGSTPALCNALLSTNIRLASNLSWPLLLQGNKILCPSCSVLTIGEVPCFLFS